MYEVLMAGALVKAICHQQMTKISIQSVPLLQHVHVCTLQLEQAQARVLAKAQQIVLNFRIRDDAELLDIIANFHGVSAHICMDKIRGANRDPHTDCSKLIFNLQRVSSYMQSPFRVLFSLLHVLCCASLLILIIVS